MIPSGEKENLLGTYSGTVNMSSTTFSAWDYSNVSFRESSGNFHHVFQGFFLKILNIFPEFSSERMIWNFKLVPQASFENFFFLQSFLYEFFYGFSCNSTVDCYISTVNLGVNDHIFHIHNFLQTGI